MSVIFLLIPLSIVIASCFIEEAYGTVRMRSNKTRVRASGVLRRSACTVMARKVLGDRPDGERVDYDARLSDSSRR